MEELNENTHVDGESNQHIIMPNSEPESVSGSDLSSSSSCSSSSNVPVAVAQEEHTYLPGTNHPLYPPSLIARRQFQNQQHNNNSSSSSSSRSRRELSVLELDRGNVLFPGSSIPLRLRHPDWVSYIQSKVDITSARVRAGPDGDGDDDPDEIAVGIVPAALDDDNSAHAPEQEEDELEHMVGRMGTLAIVTSMSRQNYDDEQIENEDDEAIHQDEVIVTALGTARFQIVAPSPEQPRTRSSSQNPNRRHLHRARNGDMAERRVYLVDILQVSCPPRPPWHVSRLPPRVSKLPHTCTTDSDSDLDSSDDDNSSNVVSQQSFMKPPLQSPPPMLHLVSPHSHQTWSQAWPWKLAHDLYHRLQQQEGLQSALQQYHDSCRNKQPKDELSPKSHAGLASRVDPDAFSFWVAAHLPLRPKVRLQLLELHGTVQRLQVLLRHLQVGQDASRDSGGNSSTTGSTMSPPRPTPTTTPPPPPPAPIPLCCLQCQTILSYRHSFFHLPGAPTSSGQYVNPHGHVHHTLTYKEIQPGKVVCVGAPQIRDSWFEGYAWIMAYCAGCFGHVGWKFVIVERDRGQGGQDEEEKEGDGEEEGNNEEVEEEGAGGGRRVRRRWSHRAQRVRRLLVRTRSSATPLNQSSSENETVASFQRRHDNQDHNASTTQRQPESSHQTRRRVRGQQVEGRAPQRPQCFWGFTASSVAERTSPENNTASTTTTTVTQQENDYNVSTLRRILVTLGSRQDMEIEGDDEDDDDGGYPVY